MSSAQVLFDATAGTLPAEQGWLFFALGGAAQRQDGEGVVLDTSNNLSSQAGYSIESPVPMNRAEGFTLAFEAQVRSEAHSTTNRAGFSVLVLDGEARGIELGFWTDRVFAQADLPLFVHAEQALLLTSNSLVKYRLRFFRTHYVLEADGQQILTGAVRDYTAFSGSLNPYRTRNLIFLGDNTTSASASVSLGRVTLLMPPRILTRERGVISWEGVAGEEYGVESSADLIRWGEAGKASSNSGSFSFTNRTEMRSGFLRVLVP